MSDTQIPRESLCLVRATDIGQLPSPDWIDPSLSVSAQLAVQLESLLDCVTVYGPDYMHGEAKKYHVKRARKALAQYKEAQA